MDGQDPADHPGNRPGEDPPSGRRTDDNHPWQRQSLRAGGAGLAAVVLVLTASAWASGFQRYTWGARLGTFGCALVVLGGGTWWRRRHPVDGGGSLAPRASAPVDRPTIDRSGLALWIGVVIVAVAWDVLGLMTPADRHHLTLSALELTYRPLHALVFACWLVVGWMLSSTPFLSGRERRRRM